MVDLLSLRPAETPTCCGFRAPSGAYGISVQEEPTRGARAIGKRNRTPTNVLSPGDRPGAQALGARPSRRLRAI